MPWYYDVGIISFTDVSPAGKKLIIHIANIDDLYPVSAGQAPDALQILLNGGFRPQSAAECSGDWHPYANQAVTIPKSMGSWAQSYAKTNSLSGTLSSRAFINMLALIIGVSSCCFLLL